MNLNLRKCGVILCAASMLALGSCSKFDELSSAIENVENRVTALEEAVAALNSNVASLQTIVAALQKNVYVTSVEQTADGYKITFSDGKTASIKNGKDGANGVNGTDGKDGVNGSTPSVSVKAGEDGIYYWTVNGEFVLDAQGNKLKAEAVTPEFKIEGGKWYVSYDKGANWAEAGQATGDSFFASVEDGEDSVTFTFADGTSVSLGKSEAKLSISFTMDGEEYNYTDVEHVKGDDTKYLRYNIANASKDVVMISWFEDASCPITAKINQDWGNPCAGNIAFSCSSEAKGKYYLLINDNGYTVIKAIDVEFVQATASFDAQDVSTGSRYVTLPAAGGEFCLTMTSVFSEGVPVVKTGSDWLSIVPQTKATYKQGIFVNASKNTTRASRTAEVRVGLYMNHGVGSSVASLVLYVAQDSYVEPADADKEWCKALDGKEFSYIYESEYADEVNTYWAGSKTVQNHKMTLDFSDDYSTCTVSNFNGLMAYDGNFYDADMVGYVDFENKRIDFNPCGFSALVGTHGTDDAGNTLYYRMDSMSNMYFSFSDDLSTLIYNPRYSCYYEMSDPYSWGTSASYSSILGELAFVDLTAEKAPVADSWVDNIAGKSYSCAATTTTEDFPVAAHTLTFEVSADKSTCTIRNFDPLYNSLYSGQFDVTCTVNDDNTLTVNASDCSWMPGAYVLFCGDATLYFTSKTISFAEDFSTVTLPLSMLEDGMTGNTYTYNSRDYTVVAE